ncbi:MAG: hypothetical protein M9962_05555 [Oligoflexia bacterium]|nr:hypothetical protein [Oligoflexia bacterium]
MKFLSLISILLSLLYSTSVFAGLYNCDISNDPKNVRIVVTFEGLMGEALGYQVYNNIGKRLKKDFKGKVDVVGYSFPQASQAVSCIMKKYKIVGDKIIVVVMGHSYGGKFGLLSTIKGLKKKDFPMEKVNALGIDPRQGMDDVAMIFKGGRINTITNPGAGKFANFYQRGLGLPGYEVNGAQNCRLSGTDHVFMPTRPEVYRTAWYMTAGKGIPADLFKECSKYNNLIADHTNSLNLFKTNKDGTARDPASKDSGISGTDEQRVSGIASGITAAAEQANSKKKGKFYKCCIGGICRDAASYEEALACQKTDQERYGR